jgi:penicillin-binding protein 1A
MANALKGQPEVELPMPANVVVKPGAGLRGGDEYFYEEFQRPNPELKLDNSGSVPRGPEDSSDAASEAQDESQKAPPKDAVENIKDQLF